MDLRTSYPYWLLKQGLLHNYQPLEQDLKTEVVVIGGGISGALTAWHLIQAGFRTLLVDRRHIGMGSTAASTALVQYEIDLPLVKLEQKIGQAAALKSYRLSLNAVHRLSEIAENLRLQGSVQKRTSLQFASYKKDRLGLWEEFQARKKAGFAVDWLSPAELERDFGFQKPGAILSADGAALDPYEFTHALLRDAEKKGLQIHDRTNITHIEEHRNHLTLTTGDHHKITAGQVVIACGYESQRYLDRKVETLKTTFAIISEPLQQPECWYQNALIWETKTPYLYLRTTPDNRIIIGGQDIDSVDPLVRNKWLPLKIKTLERSFHRLFPHLPFRTDFAWAGDFGTTKDGLPYIGTITGRPRTFFALGYGGNGITFSVIAAEFITDLIRKKNNADLRLFSFDR